MSYQVPARLSDRYATDLGDFYSLGGPPQMTPAQLMAFANSLVTPLPPPIVAAINEMPLTRAQKKTLKTEPLLFFVVSAEVMRDIFIDFLKTTHRLSGRSGWVYNLVGGGKINAKPSTSDTPIQLAAKFLILCNRHPIQAAQAASGIAMKWTGAVFSASGAAMAEVGLDLTKLPPPPGMPKIPPPPNMADLFTPPKVQVPTMPSFKLPNVSLPKVWPFAGTLGQGWEEAAVAGGGTAATAGGTTITGAQIVALVTAAITLADHLVPLLTQLADGAMPTPPPAAATERAVAAAAPGGAVDQAEQAISPQAAAAVQSDTQQLQRAQGLVPKWAYVAGGLGIVGVAAYFLTRK